MDRSQLEKKIALVTGANSGVGLETAAQLAQTGYARVILACRSLEKAETARIQLRERLGLDPFETIAIDVSNVASATSASAALIERGTRIDALVLNAGMVSGSEMKKSADGVEIAFAASIVGHHVLTTKLIEADLLSPGARIVIAGSEAARNDLPKMMEMAHYDFSIGQPAEFGSNLHDAMLAFAQGAQPEKFNEFRYYAVTKAFTSWWAAALANRYGERLFVAAVSPGSTLSTGAGRNTRGFKGFMFTKIMPLIGRYMGMDQPVELAAKRYIDVLHGAEFVSGRTYTSKPKKLVGPLFEVNNEHLLDPMRQNTAWAVIEELSAGAISAQMSP